MALVQNCCSNLTRENGGYGMGLARSTSCGRKRVALPNVGMVFGNDGDWIATTPPKRQRVPEKSALEGLPQEILIWILCGVEHDDLKRLFFVSKAMREATLIAKQSHFAYGTPKKTVGFQNAENFGDFDEIEAPNAPKQSKFSQFRLSAKNLADISVALFACDDAHRDLSLEMGTGS